MCTCIWISVCVCVCVEAMIGSLRRPVPITSSSGVQLQFIFMTFFFSHMVPAVTRRCTQRQHFSAKRPQHGKSPDSSYCLGAFTRATGTISALCSPTRLSFPLSISLNLRVFLLDCILSAIRGDIKQSLTIDAFTPFLMTRRNCINRHRQAFYVRSHISQICFVLTKYPSVF